MNFIKGAARNQSLLLPETIDDYISEDSPVRFVDKFVDDLDLIECGFQFPQQNSIGGGRPGYHPGDLLKLFIYGYLNGIALVVSLRKPVA